MPKKTSKPKCFTPGCDKPIKSRGLCLSCFRTACRMVNKKQTTWDAIVAKGLGKPRAKRAPGTSRFRQAVESLPVCGDCPVVIEPKKREYVGPAVRYGRQPVVFG